MSTLIKTLNVLWKFIPDNLKAFHSVEGNINLDIIRSITLITPPSLAITDLVYTGETLSPIFTWYNPDIMDVTGNTGVDVGSYSATFTPKDGYAWDTTNDATPITIEWTISKATPIVTTVTTPTDIVYGTALSDIIATVDSNVPGTFSWVTTDEEFATMSDPATVQWKFVPDNSNYNEITGETIIIINNIEIPVVPVQNVTLTYNGTIQYPGWDNYNSTYMTIGGTTSATNAGTYIATFTPNENYQWEDGTNTAKEVQWSIGKAVGVISTSAAALNVETGAIGTFTVTRNNTGNIIATANNTNITISINQTTGVVSVTGNNEGSSIITINVNETDNYTTSNIVQVSVTIVQAVEMYAFQLDQTVSDTTKKITYLGSNVNYTSAKMNYTAGVFDYGSWANAWFIKNIKPVVLNYDGTVAYELDKNDYTKKVDGTASNINSDTIAGNVMIGIPTVWVKIDYTVEDKPKFYFSNKKLDNSYYAYAHTDSNNKIMPYTYISAYNGWIDSSNKLRSISGKLPSGDKAMDYQFVYSYNNYNKTIWSIDLFCDRMLITLLLMLIGKSTNSQLVFGNGNYNGLNNPHANSGTNGVLKTGTMNTKGLFWGSTSNNEGVKVFGIENLWGNISRRTAGIINNTGVLYTKVVANTGDGYIGYDSPNATYIKVGNIPTKYGYLSTVYVNQYGIFPKTTTATGTTGFCDMIYITTNNDVRVASFGGYCGVNDQTFCGIFTCDFYDKSDVIGWYIGASPSCKPLVV